MYYANYEETTGQILGFYDDEIHTEIPEPSIALTDEQWEQAIEGSYRIVDGELEEYTPTMTREQKLYSIEQSYTLELDKLRSLYATALLLGKTDAANTMQARYMSLLEDMKIEIESVDAEFPDKISRTTYSNRYCPLCASTLNDNVCPSCGWVQQ